MPLIKRETQSIFCKVKMAGTANFAVPAILLILSEEVF